MERGVTLSRPAARLLVDDGATAAGGLALDEALLSSYGRNAGAQGPTIRLYTYADHCALVGRYQNLSSEVDLDAATRLGASYSRRPTGGGAIIMGKDQLGVAVATAADPSLRPRELLARFALGICEGLGSLGIDCRFEGKNDLSVQGRKIAGLGLYSNGNGGLLFHASILAGLDVELMLSLLRIPAAKLAANGVAAVAERVTTVSTLLARPMDGASIREAVAAGFAASMGVELVPAAPSSEELAEAARLREQKYSSPAWWDQDSSRRDHSASFSLRCTEGTLRCHVSLSGEVLKSVVFTGDFNVAPARLAALESALRWQRVDPAPLSQSVRRALGDGTLLDPDDLVSELVRAARSGSEPAGAVAAPSRSGSCYFPEVSRT